MFGIQGFLDMLVFASSRILSSPLPLYQNEPSRAPSTQSENYFSLLNLFFSTLALSVTLNPTSSRNHTQSQTLTATPTALDAHDHLLAPVRVDPGEIGSLIAPGTRDALRQAGADAAAGQAPAAPAEVGAAFVESAFI